MAHLTENLQVFHCSITIHPRVQKVLVLHPFLQHPLYLTQCLYIQKTYLNTNMTQNYLTVSCSVIKKQEWKGIQKISSFFFFERNYP